MNPETILSQPPRIDHAEVTRKDVILYALGVMPIESGPPTAETLNYVYEDRLRVLPTMAVIMATPGFYLRDPEFDVDWKRVLHGEQRLQVHAKLPTEGMLRSELVFDQVYDRGPDKGAILVSTRKLFNDETGVLLATMGSTAMLRGDGGCGGSTNRPPRPPEIPARDPDATLLVQTRYAQALTYRLSGDYNPLHIDPDVAVAAGFERPILHGLCSYGLVCRAVLKLVCEDNPDRLLRFDVRFSAPVYPGEALEVSLWRDGDGRALFQASVPNRNVIVLNNGVAEFTSELEVMA